MRFALVRAGRRAVEVPVERARAAARRLVVAGGVPRCRRALRRVRRSRDAAALEPRPPVPRLSRMAGPQSVDEAQQFWRETLAGFREPTPLPREARTPIDERRRVTASTSCSSSAETTDGAATARTPAAGHAEHAGARRVGASARAARADSADVVFGAAFSGRPADSAGVESMVGPFVNNLPVRVRVDRDASDRRVLARAACAAAGAERAFQYMPLDRDPARAATCRGAIVCSTAWSSSRTIWSTSRRGALAARSRSTISPAPDAHQLSPSCCWSSPGRRCGLTLIHDRQRASPLTPSNAGGMISPARWSAAARRMHEQRVAELQDAVVAAGRAGAASSATTSRRHAEHTCRRRPRWSGDRRGLAAAVRVGAGRRRGEFLRARRPFAAARPGAQPAARHVETGISDRRHCSSIRPSARSRAISISRRVRSPDDGEQWRGPRRSGRSRRCAQLRAKLKNRHMSDDRLRRHRDHRHGRAIPRRGERRGVVGELVAGKESISFFSDAELAESGLDARPLADARPLRARARRARRRRLFRRRVLRHPSQGSRGHGPAAASLPRGLLGALEHAGYAPEPCAGAVGVFAGATFNTYYLHALHPDADLIDLVGSRPGDVRQREGLPGDARRVQARPQGPGAQRQTACSTSLVAVCQACQSLLTYQCDMALAGGVSVTVPQKRGYYHDEGNIGSADGHTRTFDARRGRHRLQQRRRRRRAQAAARTRSKDGDRSTRSSRAPRSTTTARSASASARRASRARRRSSPWRTRSPASIPETIAYVEAHGTATPLGDPIEVAGLTKAFRWAPSAKRFCALGSVKTNIGHLDVAAGVAGLIKTALALHHKAIPASLHFTKPNPKLDSRTARSSSMQRCGNGKAKPARRAAPGSARSAPAARTRTSCSRRRRIVPASGPSRPWQLLVLSAKTPDALDRIPQVYVTERVQDIDMAYMDSPAALFGYRNALQNSQMEEGFSAIEKVAFGEGALGGLRRKALLLDYDGTLRKDEERR